MPVFRAYGESSKIPPEDMKKPRPNVPGLLIF